MDKLPYLGYQSHRHAAPTSFCGRSEAVAYRESEEMDEAGVLYIVVALFLVVLAILWFLLPFAIFGTKPKLDELLVETRKTNTELAEIRDYLSRSKGP